MRKFLLLPALGWSSAVFAQSADCSAIKAENVVLKDKIVAYEARLGIGVGGVAVEDGDPAIKVKFLSCKASKATHRAVLNFLVVNSGEPLVLEIESLTASNRPSQVVDEQGRAFTATSAYYPMVGGRQLKAALPRTVPLTCTITCEEVPLATTRLNAAVVSFQRLKADMTGGGREQDYFKTTLKNIPVTWGP